MVQPFMASFRSGSSSVFAREASQQRRRFELSGRRSKASSAFGAQIPSTLPVGMPPSADGTISKSVPSAVDETGVGEPRGAR